MKPSPEAKREALGPGRPLSPVDVHLPRRAVGLVVGDLGEDAGHDDEGDHPANIP